ncbi:LysR substrate-binding domain-containing protein [Defluviimonas sp. D31]|uniref:LysR substrate-binding domain-containing protein n=1 Tax=Defluviimonas sp. D31 TaxID=3083253 RepID=UPI00296F7BAB|nr:LysR substrate-binding domain-containing protein [Defluviimonas sp. D31]MDW4551608.1 LysR substrate-binding domain-containing protein [Defluviimonas sp. D31]
MKNLNRINLGGLRAIEAVARTGNLASAAEEMGVTVGAVSQQLQKVERLLGLPMFYRTSKGLQPTDRCEELLPRLARAMSDLSAAVDIAERKVANVLTISVPPVFAAKWLVWRLGEFTAAHPEVRVRIDASPNVTDPNTADVDACIRVGKGDWTGVRLVRLVDQRVFPVCSPELAGRLKAPKDLATTPIIRDKGQMFDWSTWLAPNGLTDEILGVGPVFSDASLCLDAAIGAQGVFLAWESLAFDALKSGRLVAPFPGRFRTGDAFWLVASADAKPSKSLEKFETWLVRRMNSECCPGHFLAA